MSHGRHEGHHRICGSILSEYVLDMLDVCFRRSVAGGELISPLIPSLIYETGFM